MSPSSEVVFCTNMNYDEELQRTNKEMHDAEDALAATGFSVDQWMLIKQYVLAAIEHRHLILAKKVNELSAEEPRRPKEEPERPKTEPNLFKF
jgi:hypothetical protein